MKRRIGIYGGTFNPPHIGHIQAAEAFVRSMNLDELLIMPTLIPPHKENETGVDSIDRLEMSRLAFKTVDKACVSNLEIQRGGKSYTYLTLQELASPDAELYFLCGTDMILTMDAWKNPDIIFSLAKICYIRREADADKTALIARKCSEYKERFNAQIYSIISDVIKISSSEIRSDVKASSRYLTKEVAEYIRKKGLYE